MIRANDTLFLLFWRTASYLTYFWITIRSMKKVFMACGGCQNVRQNRNFMYCDDTFNFQRMYFLYIYDI